MGNFIEKHAEAAALYNDISVLAVFPREQEDPIVVEESTINSVRRIVVYYKKVNRGLPIVSQLKKWKLYKQACDQGFDLINNLKKIDLVHLNVVYPLGFYALALQKKYQLKFIVTEHSTAYSKGPNQMSATKLNFCKKVLTKADRILPVSEDLGKTLKQLAPAVPQTIVANVVNENVFRLEEFAPTSTFVHISHAYDPHKNVSGIIRVVAQLMGKYDFNFTIISDGDLTPHRALAKDLDIPISVLTFESTKTTIEIAQILQHSKALVLFSNYENFPCVIAEAMMTGKPVISTNVNGIPEHINSSNGILVQAQDENSLLDAMISILENKIEYDASEIHNYAMQHFSYKNVGLKLNEIYQELTK